MRLEFKTMNAWEAYDAREWGNSWGVFTTREEAEEAVKRNSTPHTNAVIKVKIINIVPEGLIEKGDKLKAKPGDILKLKGSNNYAGYAMVIELRSKYNALILPNNEPLEEECYHLDYNLKDYDTIEEMISMYQEDFEIEVITMQQYIAEVGN